MYCLSTQCTVCINSGLLVKICIVNLRMSRPETAWGILHQSTKKPTFSGNHLNVGRVLEPSKLKQSSYADTGVPRGRPHYIPIAPLRDEGIAEDYPTCLEERNTKTRQQKCKEPRQTGKSSRNGGGAGDRGVPRLRRVPEDRSTRAAPRFWCTVDPSCAVYVHRLVDRLPPGKRGEGRRCSCRRRRVWGALTPIYRNSASTV